MAHARSTLATAQANLQLAQITSERYQGLLQKHAVSQQDVDNTVGAYTANKAIVDADMASVRHYEALVSFEKVYAPFDGVITTRNTDIGDLIKQNQGSESVAVGRQQVCQAGRVEGSVLAFDTGGDLCNG